MSPLTNKNSRTYLSKPLIKILLLCTLALSFPLIGAPAPDVTQQISIVVGPLPGLPGYEDTPYTLIADGAVIREDLTDADGVILFDHIPGTQTYVVELMNGQRFELNAVDLINANSTSP